MRLTHWFSGLAIAASLGTSGISHATLGAAARVKANLGNKAKRVTPIGASLPDTPVHFAAINDKGNEVRVVTVNREYTSTKTGNTFYKKSQIKVTKTSANLVPQAKRMLQRLRGKQVKIEIGDRLNNERSALSGHGNQILFTSTFSDGTKQLDKVSIELSDRGKLTLGNPHRDNSNNLRVGSPTRK